MSENIYVSVNASFAINRIASGDSIRIDDYTRPKNKNSAQAKHTSYCCVLYQTNKVIERNEKTNRFETFNTKYAFRIADSFSLTGEFVVTEAKQLCQRIAFYYYQLLNSANVCCSFRALASPVAVLQRLVVYYLFVFYLLSLYILLL